MENGRNTENIYAIKQHISEKKIDKNTWESNGIVGQMAGICKRPATERRAIAALKASDKILGQLMKAAQDGDPHAYKLLLHEILPVIQEIAANHHAKANKTERFIQIILLGINEVRHTYDPRRSFLQWIEAISEYYVRN